MAQLKVPPVPHLIAEYNTPVEAADLPAFCARMRDVMVETGVFPFAGIRVRAYRADHAVVADGGAYGFMHLVLKMGAGRDPETQRRCAEAIYSAAETWLTARLSCPHALSLEVQELPGEGLSLKRLNTIRDHLAKSPSES